MHHFEFKTGEYVVILTGVLSGTVARIEETSLSDGITPIPRYYIRGRVFYPGDLRSATESERNAKIAEPSQE